MLKKNGEKVNFNVGTQVSHRSQRVNQYLEFFVSFMQNVPMWEHQ